MSGILRRTALFSHYKDGVYDSGWRRCVSGIGGMLEPSPVSNIGQPSDDGYDATYDDMISHIDDIAWVAYRDMNRLSGTVSAVSGSSDGWVHGGVSVLYGIEQ